MSRTAWWARSAGGVAILALLVWRLGTGAFLHGLRSVHGAPVLAALLITAATTVCSALRWRLIARGLGVRLTLPGAVAHYYRSQFLNSALPGGVLGDVHRGVRHGRAAGDLGRGLRTVVWDRAAGQLVQAVLAAFVLLAFASPVRSALPVVLAGVLGCLLVAAVLLIAAQPSSGLGRARAELSTMCRWPIAVSSAVVVAGHASIFLIAARSAGTAGSLARLLPLAVLVLLAMAVPLNVGGWGPREGVAAWAFGAAGLGMSQGIATATVYGVMAFVGTLPGAVVLALDWLCGPDHRQQQPVEPLVPVGAHG